MPAPLGVDGDATNVLAQLRGDADALRRAEPSQHGDLGVVRCSGRVARHALILRILTISDSLTAVRNSWLLLFLVACAPSSGGYAARIASLERQVSYVARGEYELASADEAVLGFTVRGGCTTGNGRGRLVIKRGKGTFELATRIAYAGEPHISIFRAGHGHLTNADELGSVMLGKASRAKPPMLNRVLGGDHP